MASLDEYIAQVEAGFLLTCNPTPVPEVQDKIVSRVSCGTHEFYDQVRASVGAEGAQYAHEKSLKFIRQHLNWFYEIDGTKVTIPRNALTVSFSIPSFAVGNSCQDFFPVDKEVPEDSVFTYRMLSKQCQATYYNEGGVEFLAGICYYLQLADCDLLTTDIDKGVMCVTAGGNIPYPLRNRWKTWRFRNHRKYGRDCASAGKHVQVKLEKGKHAVHQVYNYRTFKYEYEECEECRKEAKTYKFKPGENRTS